MSKIRELIREILGEIPEDKRKTVEDALREALEAGKEQEGDGYLYFDGGDPRLPAGVAVEVRDGTDDPWVYRKYGYFSDIGTYQYETTKGRFKFLRVKKSHIIDIGDRARGRLVEGSWDTEVSAPVIGLCLELSECGRYIVHSVPGRDWCCDHVRLINNAEVV